MFSKQGGGGFGAAAVPTAFAIPVEEDVIATLLVEKLSQACHNLASEKVRSQWITAPTAVIRSIIDALLALDLHLPENSQARESISKTPIIECLVKIMILQPPFSAAFVQHPEVSLMGHLVYGGHTSNITKCYQSQAIPHLVLGLRRGVGYTEECAKVLKMLKIDYKPGTERLIDVSSIKAVVEAMTKIYVQKSDSREWGCSSLTYILNGYDGGDDIGEVFLDSGAIDAIFTAFTDNDNLTPNVVREASGCLLLLAEKSPAICKTLAAKGLVMQLGAVMHRWPRDSVNVTVPAQAALLAILTRAGN